MNEYLKQLVESLIQHIDIAEDERSFTLLNGKF